MTDNNESDDSEYRPTDWLAISSDAGMGWAHGVGATEKQAIEAVLRYAGDWADDRTRPISVALWELQADSWETVNPSGPERSADQLSFRELEIPIEAAAKAHERASEANRAVERALAEAETVRRRGKPDQPAQGE